MTGRAAGYCAGYNVPGYMNPVGGRGFGGRGRRNWYRATGMPGWARAAQGYPAWGRGPAPAAGAQAPPYAPSGPTAERELAMLQDQAEAMSQQLEQINQRIAELEQQQQED
jgi:hypothetical protein